jgi:hypothetical protein
MLVTIAARGEFSEVCLPPTQAEIAQALEPAFWVELWVQLHAMPQFCPCAFASDRTSCLRRLRLSRLRYRPRARARRQRHGGSHRERSPPGDDGDGGGSDPPPARRSGKLFWGRHP